MSTAAGTRGSVASYCDRIVDQYQPTQCPEAAPPAANGPDAGCKGDDILARHPSLNPDALQHFGLTQTGHCMGGSHLHWMVHLPVTSSMLLLMGAGNLASAQPSHVLTFLIVRMIDDSDSRELVLLPVAVVESTVPTRYRFAPIHPNLLAAPSMFDHMRSVEKENAMHVNATIMATLELEDMPYLVPKD